VYDETEVEVGRHPVKASVLFLALLCPSLSCLVALPKYVQSRVLFNADNSDGLYSAFAYYAATSCVYLFLGLSSNAIFTAICYWMTGNGNI
jgi:ABC-type multidrug transport system permease subunit